jgi:hypothetical protein
VELFIPTTSSDKVSFPSIFFRFTIKLVLLAELLPRAGQSQAFFPVRADTSCGAGSVLASA